MIDQLHAEIVFQFLNQPRAGRQIFVQINGCGSDSFSTAELLNQRPNLQIVSGIQNCSPE